MLKSRISWKHGLVMLASAALCGLRAQAALPELPTSAVVGDSFVIVHVDGAKVDPTSIDQSVTALLGPSAAMVGPKVQMFKDELKEMTEAGAQSLTVVASGDPNTAPPTVIGYIRLKPGTDHAAFQQKARDEQAKEAQANGGKTPEIDMKDDGDYVIMRDKNSPVSEAAADGERAKKFTAAFSSENKALSAVFIPTDKIRQQMKDDLSKDQNGPAWAKQMGSSIAESQHVALSVTLGESPTVDLNVQTADEEGGKKLADAVDQATQQMKAQADQMKQGGPQFAAMASAISDLADSLKPKQEGSKVGVSVQGKVLGPAISNILPMMMFGGPGRGAPANGRPAGGL